MFSAPVCFPQALSTEYTGQMFQLLSVLFYFLIYLFIFGRAMSSSLCRLFSNCVRWGRLFVAVLGLLIVLASQVTEHGLWGVWASAVMATNQSGETKQLPCQTELFRCCGDKEAAATGCGLPALSPAHPREPELPQALYSEGG